MQPFFERQTLHFACTRCGRCCVAGGDYYVFLSGAEAERMRNHLHLSRSWFRRRYLERLEGGELVLAAGQGDRCIFLDDAGQCRVYPVRPVQCRTYPFWPELVGTARAWGREAHRCEGINRGAEVPVGRIRRAIEACS